MSSPTNKSFIFCVHAHQPVGNFDSVFIEAYEKSYRPFFEVLEKHPAVAVSCHFSGSLMDWLEKKRPDFILMLQAMKARGQLEMMGGAYYEPVYGLIPKNDLAGQMEMMGQKIKQLFGKFPQGAWLTERVWDPSLVKVFKSAAIQYTVLDDLHFEKAGVRYPVTGYYQTKDKDATLNLFASMKQLRYLMPFRKVEETIEFIHAEKADPEEVFVFADDVEKFGLWPGTYNWVYKEGWLDHFLTLLENDSSISVYTFSQFIRRFRPKGFVRVPHASYSEMMEWSGGNFYNFLKKYPESRYMRDRMWNLSRQVQTLCSRNGLAKKCDNIKQLLYKAQCNCSYWHGVFGGLYLHHLRSAVFENIIQAETAISLHAKKSPGKEHAVIRRVELDSGERWQIRQKEIVTFFNPAYGGSLEELDCVSKSVNLMCNLQRHKEAYHETVLSKTSAVSQGTPLSIHQMLGSKEKNLEDYLYYDAYRRLSFMDHLFQETLTLEEFKKSCYNEIGDFAGAPYKASLKTDPGARSLIFERKGHLNMRNKKQALSLKKIVHPKGAAGLRVHYLLKNLSTRELRFVLGVEFNFSIGENRAMNGLDEANVKEWIFNDAWRGIRIELRIKNGAHLLAFPVETVSESELGLEKTYQELAVLLQSDFYLRPGETKEHPLELLLP